MSGYLGLCCGSAEDEVQPQEVAAAAASAPSLMPVVMTPLLAYLALKPTPITRGESRLLLALAAVEAFRGLSRLIRG